MRSANDSGSCFDERRRPLPFRRSCRESAAPFASLPHQGRLQALPGQAQPFRHILAKAGYLPTGGAVRVNLSDAKAELRRVLVGRARPEYRRADRGASTSIALRAFAVVGVFTIIVWSALGWPTGPF